MLMSFLFINFKNKTKYRVYLILKYLKNVYYF